MTIAPANPSSFPLWIASQISMERALACCSCLEGVFYSSLKGGSLQSKKLVKWIRETSVAHINKIQMVFNLASVGTVLFYSEKLLAKHPLLLLLGGGTTVIAKVVLNKHREKTLRPPYHQGDIEISEKSSFPQRAASYLHIAKLATGILFICFTQNPFWLAIGMASTLYSFRKNLQLKWLNFSKTFSFPWRAQEPRIQRSQITYKMLALSSSSTNKGNCTICLDNNPDTAFCVHHLFHRECLANLVRAKASSFNNNNSYKRTDTRHYRDHVYMGTTRSYSVRIPQQNLPSCPNCRNFLRQNDCDVRVTDFDHGTFNANVTIDRPDWNKQFLFETLYATYNVVQTTLSFFQKHPKLAATIFKIQKFLLVTDVIGYAFTLYFLCQKLSPRLGLGSVVIVGAGAAAIGVLSCSIIAYVNAYLKSAFILKDLLAQLPIPAEFLSASEISWGAPSSHWFMQWFSLNRAAASLALAYFSKLNLISVTAQLLNFLNISYLQWIHIIQKVQWPFEKVLAGGGSLASSLSSRSLSNLTLDFHFMVDRSCTKESFHLQSVLKSISGYCNRFLNKSSWDAYWNVTYQNGVEVGRRLHFTASLPDTPLEPCGCTLTPALTGFWMKAISSFFSGLTYVDTKWVPST